MSGACERQRRKGMRGEGGKREREFVVFNIRGRVRARGGEREGKGGRSGWTALTK